MPHSIESHPELDNHDLSAVVAAMQRGTGVKSRERPPDRNTPEWYQAMVRYYLERRQPLEEYWKLTEERYRPTKYERATSGYKWDTVEPGRVFKMLHRTEAELLGNPPKFKLRGFSPKIDSERVPGLELGINNEWSEDLALLDEMAISLRYTGKYGFAPILTTYDAEFEEEPEKRRKAADKRKANARDNPMLGAAVEDIALEVAATQALGPTPTSKTTVEMDDRVLTDSINTRVVSPWHFLIDPDASCLENARWVGRIIVADLEAVKADDRYDNTADLVACDPSSVSFGFKLGHEDKWPSSSKKTPYDLVILYELFERMLGGGWRRITISHDHPHFLEIVERPFWIGQPYTLLRWNHDGDYILPQNDVLNVDSELRAEADIMSKMTEGYGRDQEDITFVAEDTVTDEELYDAETGEPNRYVYVKSTPPSGRLPDAFYQPMRQAKSPDALNFLFAVQRSLESSMGLGANQQAQALKSDTSAAEVQEISASVRAGFNHKQRAFERALVSVARQRLGLMAEFYDKTRILRIAGVEAATVWPEDWTEGDVQNGLLVLIERGSTMPRNDMADFQNAVQIMGLAAANPMIMGNTNWVKLQKFAYRALMGVTGDSLLIETDETKIGEAAQNFALMQAAGGGSKGSAPRAGGTPAQNAGGGK